ncbi:MAG: imidazole glycerol phosphate synthase subunit HisH [Alphaproteobacteria bacterium]
MTISVAIIDYGAGNLRSACKAFAHIAARLGVAGRVVITDQPEEIQAAERLVLPGQGAFADCMAGLRGKSGMVEALSEAVLQRGQPFLGICVGMQLLADYGYEHGTHQGLGWIKGEVQAIPPQGASGHARRIPHMGWNDLRWHQPDLLAVSSCTQAYFVHSYHFIAQQPENILATTDYDGELVAVIGRDNILATQFHPEKSHDAGLSLIEHFLRWKP